MHYFEFINSFDPSNTPMTPSESALMADLMLLSTKPLNKPFKTLLADIQNLLKGKKSPSCFISYAWVSDNVFPEQLWTQEFIYRIENWLTLAGVTTYIDREDSRFGHHMKTFMKQKVEESDFVLLIGTKALRSKLNSKDFYNVQVEYKFISERLQFELTQKSPHSIVPLIISGKGKEALPDELFGRVAIEDFSGNDLRAGQINALVEHLYGLIAKLHSINLTDNTLTICQIYKKLWENFRKQYILVRGNHAGNISELSQPLFSYFKQAKQRQRYFGKQKFRMTHNLPENKGKPYFGRQEEIQSLLQNIRNNPKPHASLTTVISGLGGIGKTSLAKQIVFQLQATGNLATRTILWFKVNDQINNSLYQEVIQNLGLNIDAVEYTQQQKWLFAWLRDHPGWVLILDNVTDHEQIKPYLPPNGGNIIITSRSTLWQEGPQLTQYSLEKLNVLESCNLLRQYIKDENEDCLKLLAGTLDFLPLALVQAGAFIKKNKFLTIHGYLKLLQEQPSQVTQLYKENKNVWLTLNISLELIRETNSRSTELLNFCSLFGALDIPNDLLYQLAGYEKFMQLVINLNPIISYYIVHADKANEKLSLHPLVAAIVFDSLTPSEKKAKIERSLFVIKELFSKKPSDDKSQIALVGFFLELTHKANITDNSQFVIDEMLYSDVLLLILPILFNQDNMPALARLVPSWYKLLENPAILKNNELYLNLLNKLVSYRIKTRNNFEYLEKRFIELDTMSSVPATFTAIILLNRGIIAIELKKYKSSIEYLSAAIEVGSLSSLEQATAYGNLCTAYTLAEMPLDEVDEIAKKGYELIGSLEPSAKNISLLTYIKGNVAEYYIKHGKWQEAKQLRLECIRFLESVTTQNTDRGLSWNFYSLGNIECEFGDLNLAKTYFQQFIDKMNKVFGVLSNWPDDYLKTKEKLENKILQRVQESEADISEINSSIPSLTMIKK